MKDTRAGIVVYRIHNEELQLLMISPKTTYATVSILEERGPLKQTVIDRMSDYEYNLFKDLTVDSFTKLSLEHKQYYKSSILRYDRLKNNRGHMISFIDHVRELIYKRYRCSPFLTLPKGGVEKCDYKQDGDIKLAYKNAACRELYEETGYCVNSHLLQNINEINFIMGDRHLIFWVVKATDDFNPITMDSNEVDEASWKTFDKELLKVISRDTKILLYQISRKIECGHPVTVEKVKPVRTCRSECKTNYNVLNGNPFQLLSMRC